MYTTFKFGDRVRVLANQGFPAGSIGKIESYPFKLVQGSGDLNGFQRHIQGVKKKFTFMWVRFDEPQMDGDCPYLTGEINTDGLELIDLD